MRTSLYFRGRCASILVAYSRDMKPSHTSFLGDRIPQPSHNTGGFDGDLRFFETFDGIASLSFVYSSRALPFLKAKPGHLCLPPQARPSGSFVEDSKDGTLQPNKHVCRFRRSCSQSRTIRTKCQLLIESDLPNKGVVARDISQEPVVNGHLENMLRIQVQESQPVFARSLRHRVF